MASFLDSLMGFGGRVAAIPQTFFEAGYAATPSGARQLEEQKQRQKLIAMNQILAQSGGQLSQEQLSALGSMSPEFTQARLSALIPKPMNAANLEFNPVTGEAYTTQYNPNAQQLDIKPYGGVQPQQPGVLPGGLPQQGAGGQPDPTAGMMPKAKMEYQQKTAQLMAEKEAAKPKLFKSYASATAQMQNMLDNIASAKGKAATGTTGTIGAILGLMPGTDAYDLRNADNLVLTANNFVNGLAEMRANSPTGGAVGSVTEREGEKLQSTLAAINPNLSQTEYKKQLNSLQSQLVQSHKRISDAIKMDFGENLKLPELKTEGKGSDFESKYNAMPSGTVFTAPDGTRRRKP
jgi:hypothetical protein